MEDFNRQKIVWGNLNLKASYVIAPRSFFCECSLSNDCPGKRVFVSELYSKLADYYIRKLGVTRNGGYFEYKPMFIRPHYGPTTGVLAPLWPLGFVNYI